MIMPIKEPIPKLDEVYLMEDGMAMVNIILNYPQSWLYKGLCQMFQSILKT